MDSSRPSQELGFDSETSLFAPGARRLIWRAALEELANARSCCEEGGITERLADGTWLCIWGIASGRFEGSVLQASGRGEAMHCPVSQESAWNCPTRFCASDEFRLTFSRQQGCLRPQRHGGNGGAPSGGKYVAFALPR